MDWQSLRAKYPTPPGASPRTARLLALSRVLDCVQYDVLPNDFMTEKTGSGEYVPLSRRRPSVRTNLCRTVVDDSVSLLFGEGHFPAVRADTENTTQALEDFARSSCLPAIMAHAATRGSIGSVAILVEINDRRPLLTVLDTPYLTPTWAPDGVLTKVRERYTVKGADLMALGYALADDQRTIPYWYERTFTDQDTIVMLPIPVASSDEPKQDEERSVRHGLGFVPIVWVRNSECSSDDPEGECTFERAIDTVIEADYLLSQGGRALRYASDPTLVLKAGSDPGAAGPAHQGGAASAVQLPPDGDAKLLEINGSASSALLAHYRELRSLVLEQVHGNRAHADKISAATSGRAMEMMCLPLIWLSEGLRRSYGAGGLIPLYQMVCRFSSVVDGGIEIDGNHLSSIDPTGIALHWPAWFTPTEQEILTLAQGLVTAVDGGLMSNEMACMLFSSAAGVPNASEQWAKVQQEIASGAKVAKSPKETRQDALDGKTLTHKATA